MSQSLASFSQQDTHRQCPQKWAFRYCDNIIPISDATRPVSLWVGTWWHALRAADNIMQGHAEETLKYKPTYIQGVDGFDTNVEEFLDDETTTLYEAVVTNIVAWHNTLDSESVEALVELLGESPDKALTKLHDKYTDVYFDSLSHRHVVAVELPFQKILVAKSNNPNLSEDYAIRGFVDAVIWDSKANRIIIQDAKTHKSITDYTMGDIGLSSQLNVYAWGVADQIKKWNYPVPSVLEYDRVRVKHQAQPAVTKAGKLAKTPSDYDAETYRQWAKGEDGKGIPYPGTKKDGSGAGVYTFDAKVYEALNTPTHWAKYFRRQNTLVNRHIVASHLMASADSAEAMAKSRGRWEESGATARNYSRGCTSCDYAQLCKATLVGGPRGEYDLREMGLQKK